MRDINLTLSDLCPKSGNCCNTTVNVTPTHSEPMAPRMAPMAPIDLSVTLTLRPCMYRFQPYEQYMKVREILKSIFRGFRVTYVLELTKEENIHVHAICAHKKGCNLPISLLHNRCRQYHKQLGRRDICQVVSYQSWTEYLIKDVKETTAILNINPVLQDDYQLTQNKLYLEETPVTKN